MGPSFANLLDCLVKLNALVSFTASRKKLPLNACIPYNEMKKEQGKGIKNKEKQRRERESEKHRDTIHLQSLHQTVPFELFPRHQAQEILVQAEVWTLKVNSFHHIYIIATNRMVGTCLRKSTM